MTEIYLLSILDGLDKTLGFMTGMLALFSATAFIFVSAPDSLLGAKERRASGWLGLSCLIACLLFAALAILVPSRRDLIESYVIIEGKEVVTAENLEEIANRIDEIVSEKVDLWEEGRE